MIPGNNLVIYRFNPGISVAVWETQNPRNSKSWKLKILETQNPGRICKLNVNGRNRFSWILPPFSSSLPHDSNVDLPASLSSNKSCLIGSRRVFGVRPKKWQGKRPTCEIGWNALQNRHQSSSSSTSNGTEHARSETELRRRRRERFIQKRHSPNPLLIPQQ